MTEAIIIVLILLAIVVLFIVIVSMRPSSFRVNKSTAISAPPADIFAVVNDFHNWDAWSPWAKLDPTMEQTYEGAPSGTSAIYNWSGRGQVGAGRMTILESKPYELIRIKLEFFRPGRNTNAVEFTFRPEGNQTVVSWDMSGNCGFMIKMIGLFMNMEKMIGKDFEKGLAQLKSLVEGKKP